MHLDIELTLRWNLVEATATSITLHIYDTQTIAGILSDALETCQQALIDFVLEFACLSLQSLFLFASFLHNLVELALLLLQSHVAVCQQLLSVLKVAMTLVDFNHSVLYLLLAKFNLQVLEFYLLSQGVILAVVLHLVELFLIALHTCLSLLNLSLLLRHSILEFVDFVLDLLHTSVQTYDFVFQVLHLKRQLTS